MLLGSRAGRLMQASRITPPLRGSRQDEGGARRRAGGGPTRRSVSESERWVGGAGRQPGGLARTRPGVMEEVREKAGSVRIVRECLDRRLVAGIRMRARRPRSRGGIVHTLNREHGLHRARESGKAPYASLKYHSPLEGESARQGRSPPSSRRGANAAFRKCERALGRWCRAPARGSRPHKTRHDGRGSRKGGFGARCKGVGWTAGCLQE